MIYPYHCDSCGHDQEIIKPYQVAGMPEWCEKCREKLRRVYEPLQIKTKDIYSGYNPGLGKHIKNRSDLADALKAHKDKTGIELVEVGNEKPNPRKNREITLSQKEMRDATNRIQSVEG